MDQKKKAVYYLHEEPIATPAVQTEFPIITMVYPGIEGVKKYSQAFKDIIFWNYFTN